MFSPIDVCFMICLLCGALWGMFKGLSGELAQLIATIICLVLSIKLSPIFTQLLETKTELTKSNAVLIAVVLSICLCFLLLFILKKLFKKILKVVIEVRYDKVFGFFAGIIHYGIILIIVIVVMGLMPYPPIHKLFIEESVIGTNVMKLFPKVVEVIEDRTDIDFPDELEGKQEDQLPKAIEKEEGPKKR
jgi:uncharacterized membrane protein required for colicin V production